MIIFCFLVAFIFIIPTLDGTLRIGADTAYHINRIISLKKAINNNDFFPRILFDQNYGFGYGSPLFYSIVFLYPFAYLSKIGFSPYDVYSILIFAIAFLSALSMYKCSSLFFKQKRSKYVYFTVFLYIINLFFLSNIFKRGAIGEGFAYIFVPIVIYAMYRIVYLDKRSWLLLSLSFSGLLIAHNITFILMCIVFLILLVIEHKRVWKDKQILLSIGVAAIVAVLLTSFYTLMMFEQLQTNLYRINNYFDNDALTGINLKELFNFSNKDGVYLNNNIGPILMFFPWLTYFSDNSSNKKFMVLLVTCGYIMIFMTTIYFPWSVFKFLSFIQFPGRVLTLACAFMSLGVGYGLSKISLKKKIKKYLIYIILILTIITSILQLHGIINEWGVLNKDTTEEKLTDVSLVSEDTPWYNTLEVSSPDYIYIDSNIHFKEYGRVIKSNNEEDKTVFDTSNYNQTIFTVGSVKEDAYYILPISYYKGYVVDLYEDDVFIKQIETYIDKETGLLRFDVDPYDGEKLLKFVAYYKETTIQHIGVIVSKYTLIFIFIYILFINLLKLYFRFYKSKT